MRRSNTTLIVLVSILICASATAAVKRVEMPAKGRYIVILDAGSPALQHAARLADLSNGKLVHTYTTVLNGFSAILPEQAAESLAKNPLVKEVWEVPFVETYATQTQLSPPKGLDRIDQLSLGLDGRYLHWLPDPGETAPVTLYIADTGMDPNTQFGSRVSVNINFNTSSSGVRDPNNYSDGGLPIDNTWHGTASGIIAAGSTHGVAKWVNIVNVRVITGVGTQTGTYDDVVAGIDWITARAVLLPAQRHVANASFGGPTFYEPAKTSWSNSISAGVAWIFAAGNSGEDACEHFPAQLGVELSGAITVGAMNPDDDRVTSYSNQGPCVEIYAPADVQIGHPGGAIGEGTSSAAPHVAGIFAIRWAQRTFSSAGEIEGIIKGSATPGRLSNLWLTSEDLLLYYLPRTRAVGQ